MADNLIQQALSRGYSIDEIANKLSEDAGFAPDEIRSRGYSSQEIIGKLGYEMPAQKESMLDKAKATLGWNTGRDVTVPDSITRDASEEIEEPKAKRNILMENSLMRGYDGAKSDPMSDELKSIPIVQKVSKPALQFERQKESNRKWLDNSKPLVVDQLMRDNNLSADDAELEFTRMRNAGVVPKATETGLREATWGEAFDAGIAKVKPSFDKSMAGLASMKADMTGDFELANVADALRKEANDQLAAAEGVLAGTSKDSWKKTISDAPASLAQNLPTVIAASALASNPALAGVIGNIGLAGMGMISGGASYSEGKDAGLNASNNLQQSALKAMAEVIPEKMSLSVLTNALGKKAAEQAMKDSILQSAKTLGKYIGSEIGTEELTTIAQFGVDKMYSKPGMPMKELVSQMIDTAKATLIQAPILGGAGILSQAAVDNAGRIIDPVGYQLRGFEDAVDRTNFAPLQGGAENFDGYEQRMAEVAANPFGQRLTRIAQAEQTKAAAQQAIATAPTIADAVDAFNVATAAGSSSMVDQSQLLNDVNEATNASIAEPLAEETTQANDAQVGAEQAAAPEVTTQNPQNPQAVPNATAVGDVVTDPLTQRMRGSTVPDLLIISKTHRNADVRDAAQAELKRRETEYAYSQNTISDDQKARQILDEKADQDIAQAEAINNQPEVTNALQAALKRAGVQPSTVAEQGAPAPTAQAPERVANGAQFTKDGGLHILGDVDEIKSELASYGFRNVGIPYKGGLLVSKKLSKLVNQRLIQADDEAAAPKNVAAPVVEQKPVAEPVAKKEKPAAVNVEKVEKSDGVAADGDLPPPIGTKADYSKIIPYNIQGNKTQLLSNGLDSLLRIAARGAKRVIDAFGGAAAYTHALAHNGDLPNGSIYNEFEPLRYITNKQIKENVEQVISRLEFHVAKINKMLAGDESAIDKRKLVTEYLRDGIDAHRQSGTPKHADGMKSPPSNMADSPDLAALYIIAQNSRFGFRPIQSEIGSDGKIRVMSDSENELVAIRKDGVKLFGRSKSKIVDSADQLREASKRLQGVDVRMGDGWLVSANEATDGDVVLVDTSYLNKGKTKTSNYNKATEEDAVPAVYKEKITKNLLPAWDRGAKIVITNNWDDDVVAYLKELGFTVIQDERAKGVSNDTRELIAINFDQRTGAINRRGGAVSIQPAGSTSGSINVNRDGALGQDRVRELAAGSEDQDGTVPGLDGGIKYSKSSPAITDTTSTPLPQQTAERLIASELGSTTLAKVLVDSGIVSFVNRGSQFQGATFENGNIVLNLDALTEQNFAGVFKHEGFHSTVRELVGEETWNQLMSQLEQNLKAANGNDWVTRANAAIPADTKASDRTEEIGAYAIEQVTNGAKVPNFIKRWVDSLLSAIRTALIRGMGGEKAKLWAMKHLKPQDLANLAIAGLKAKARNELASQGRAAMAYSVKRESLLDMPAVKIAFNAAGTIQEAKLRAKIAYAKLQEETQKNGFAATTTDGKQVKFSGAGFKEVSQHAADRRALAILANAKALVESAMPLYSEAPSQKEQGVRMYHYYGVKADINGDESFALLEIKETTNGEWFYDADATDAETARAVYSAALADQTKSGAGVTEPTALKGRLAKWLAGVNGDPIVPKLSTAFGPESQHRTPLGDVTEIEVDGVKRPALNSNGKPIHWSREGVENFWRWFSDSRVVDDQGRPLVVYHGTTADVEQFDLGFSGSDGVGYDVPAIFATTDKNLANDYSLNKFNREIADAMRAMQRFKNENPGVYGDEYERLYQAVKEAFAKQRNEGRPELGGGANVVPLYMRGDMAEVDANGQRFMAVMPKALPDAMAQGKDGVIVNDVIDNASPATDYPARVFVTFKPENVKSATGNTGDFDGSNPDIRYSKASPAQPAPLPEETKARAVQRKVQDKFNRFTVIKGWLKEHGVQLSEQADVYKAEERMHSRFANKVEDFRTKLVEPLIKKIQAAGFSMDDVSLFLHAQHAEERNNQIAKINPTVVDGSGMSTADANKVLAAAPAELKALANEFRQITEMTKQTLLDAGIISQDMVDAWEGAYSNYVPLKGGPDEKAKSGTGKGLHVNGKMKRALGHGKREGGEWIAENILADYERAVMLAEKNRVGHHLVRMALEAGRDDLITLNKPEKRAVLFNSGAFVVMDGSVQLAAFNKKEDAKLFVAKRSGAGLNNLSIKFSHDPQVVYLASEMLEDNEANVYVNGHAIRVQINDELLARAYKNLGAEPLNAILHAGRELNGYLSKAYTGYNPEFILTNIVRDFTTGLINITGEEGALFAAKAAKNYVSSFGSLLKYAVSGKETQWIKDYRDDGGNTGAAYLSDLERLGKEIKTEYDSYKGVIENLKARDGAGAARAAGRNLFNVSLKWIEHLNQAGENAMRLSIYRAAIESGKTRAEAASLAKNSTVNFNRKGEFGANINALYLFFNAGVQGTSALAHAHFKGKHKYQAWALSSGMIGLGFLAAAAFGGGDEDDYDRELSDYDKSRNLVIRAGDSWVKIPVPYGYGFFYNLGRHLADAERKGEWGKMPWHLASDFVGEFTPFSGVVAGKEPDMKQAIFALPTVAQIPGALMVNRTGMGSPIFPENKFDENQPDNLKMWRNTKGTIADDLAQVLDKAGLEVSPETLKYLGRTATGGSGAFVGSVFDAGKLTLEGADLETKEMPFVHKFVKEGSVSDYRSAFYEAKSEASKAADDFARAKKMGDMMSAKKLMEDNGELIAMDKYADRLSKMIKAKRDMQDVVKQDEKLTVAEKRLKLKALELEEQKVYDRYLDIFKQRTKERRERLAAVN